MAFGVPETHPRRPTATPVLPCVERVLSAPMGAALSQRSLLDARRRQAGREHWAKGWPGKWGAGGGAAPVLIGFPSLAC